MGKSAQRFRETPVGIATHALKSGELPIMPRMTEQDYKKVEPLMAPHFTYLKGLFQFLEHRNFQALKSGELALAEKWELVADKMLKRLNLPSEMFSEIVAYRSWRELLRMYRNKGQNPNDILSPETLLTNLAYFVFEVFEKETAHQSFQDIDAEVKKQVHAHMEARKRQKAARQQTPAQIEADFAALLKKWQTDYEQFVALP